ncbi:hypothetical protein Emed_006120 [Eimeria media]
MTNDSDVDPGPVHVISPGSPCDFNAYVDARPPVPAKGGAYPRSRRTGMGRPKIAGRSGAPPRCDAGGTTPGRGPTLQREGMKRWPSVRVLVRVRCINTLFGLGFLCFGLANAKRGTPVTTGEGWHCWGHPCHKLAFRWRSPAEVSRRRSLGHQWHHGRRYSHAIRHGHHPYPPRLPKL